MLSFVRYRAFRPVTGGGLSLSKRTLVLGSTPRLAQATALDGLHQSPLETAGQQGITSTAEEPDFPYWQSIPRWKDVSGEQFKSYSWQVSICGCDVCLS